MQAFFSRLMILVSAAFVPLVRSTASCGKYRCSSSETLDDCLQGYLNTAIRFAKGTALSFGAALPTHTISLSAGNRDQDANAAAVEASDKFAMGSTAKMYTAAAVMRLVDAGKIKLDESALPLMDTLWTRMNGSSLVNTLGSKIKDVTVRQLLGMRSGIPDFDNMQSRSYQFDHPDTDLGPVDEIGFLSSPVDFDCTPGTCGEYSSTNYELLGLILAQQAGATSWDQYTQASDLGTVLQKMPNTAFAVHGHCSKYTDVHGYSREVQPPADVYDISCTNGWTCGNLVSNAADAAFFVRALLGSGGQVVSDASRNEMLKMKAFTTGWSTGLPYGLGLMDMSKNVRESAGTFVGHGGETYGFNAMTAYSKTHDFGLSIVANTENTFFMGEILPTAYCLIASSLSANSTRDASPAVAMMV